MTSEQSQEALLIQKDNLNNPRTKLIVTEAVGKKKDDDSDIFKPGNSGKFNNSFGANSLTKSILLKNKSLEDTETPLRDIESQANSSMVGMTAMRPIHGKDLSPSQTRNKEQALKQS